MLRECSFFESLCGLGVTSRIEVFDQLVAAYRDPSRHYHTKAHIAACLAELERYRSFSTRPDEIAIAIWFHDAVYDTHRADNEALSAVWAESYLTSVGVDAEAITRISEMILATKTHDAQNADTALMVDIDLHILGAPTQIFEAYDRAIRQEYHWVPKTEYREQRAQILQGFLQREFIYKTMALREQYEAQARQNLQRKVNELIVA